MSEHKKRSHHKAVKPIASETAIPAESSVPVEPTVEAKPVPSFWQSVKN